MYGKFGLEKLFKPPFGLADTMAVKPMRSIGQSCLATLFQRQPARLTAIFIAPMAGAAMQRVEAVEAGAGQGLKGDRYALGNGFWKVTEACEVTLIHAEDLARASRRFQIDWADGRHRRNLVVAGLVQVKLQGQFLRIGEALFSWQRPRPPCGYLDQIAGKGTAKALGKRSGSCLQVVHGGWIRSGDLVHVVADRTDSSGLAAR